MGINDGEPFTPFDVRTDQIEKERTLSGARCTNQMDVPYPLLKGKGNGLAQTCMFIPSKKYSTPFQIQWSGSGAAGIGSKLWGLNRFIREVRKGDEFLNVEEHPASMGMPHQDIVLKRVPIASMVREGKEVVASRALKGTHRGDRRRKKLPTALLRTYPNTDLHRYSIERPL
jgi:hypothetical protein